MRIKDTKTTFFIYFPYECAAVEEYLEEMAEKGWLLQSIKGNFFKFKKIEAKKIKYSVDVFNKVSVFDHKDSNVALEYREYCEAAGWIYVCEKDKIQIFYSDNDKQTISIHTDEREKFKAVFKSSIFNVICQAIVILSLIYIAYVQIFDSTDFVLSYNFGILSLVIGIFGIFISILRVTNFFIWLIKARRKIKENKLMPYNNYKQIRIKNILIKVYLLAIIFVLSAILIFDSYGSEQFSVSVLLIGCIPIIISICVKGFINRKRYSKNINRAITISSTIASIFLVLMIIGHTLMSSITEIPERKVPTAKLNLTLINFGYKENKDKSPYIRFNKSILAQTTKYICGNDDNSLSYDVFQSQYICLVKFDENVLLSRLNKWNLEVKQEDTKLSSNIKVYSYNKKSSFILVGKDRVVDITKGFSNVSDEEFLNIVYKKLFG